MDLREETMRVKLEKSSPGSPLFLSGVDSDSDDSPSSSCEDMTKLVKDGALIGQSPKEIHPEPHLQKMPPAENGHFHPMKSNITSGRLVDDIDSEMEEQREEAAQWKHLNDPQTNDQSLSVDPRDLQTPDKWIPRHPDLIRLTGKHPFNCEPPLQDLVESGPLTPVPLHYVRNHGHVPKLDWDTWEIEVTGNVRLPSRLTMADLVALPAREIPVTLVCVGNRRKEQNATKQSLGFSWGAAAASTSMWKGARLCDVLRKCGILPASNGARFVCFEGAETLPGGGGSTYGTSLERSRAMDPSMDVLLAYEQNGRPLTPDHGFPVRLIIPGFIGGRMVKWLAKIEVTSEESQNYYHFHDNRVLPSHVDAETAAKEGWWRKPNYICNELSINSAISHPGNMEEVRLAGSQPQTLLLQGYAYSGGGRQVTRVDVTLDGGASWRVCNLRHEIPPTRYGRHWCWLLWALEVPVGDIARDNCQEIAVRAWDAGTNTQPEHLTWNLLGMMNNCWFRVRVHKSKSSDGSAVLRFEHPTMPGTMPGGWMYSDNPLPLSAARPKEEQAEVKREQKVEQAAQSKPSGEKRLRRIPMSEVAKHDTEESAWIVVHGKVYDCTPFLKAHPGGAESITMNAGMDATEDFDAVHSDRARAMLEEYLIGQLAEEEGEGEGEGEVHSVHGVSSAVDGSTAALVNGFGSSHAVGGGKTAEAASSTATATEGGYLVTLTSPRQKVRVPLIHRQQLSHDSYRFRFGLPSDRHVLGLPVGKHVMLYATVGGKMCARAYTPSTLNDAVGYFDLVVKVYSKTDAFPEGGRMSQHLASLRIGDNIDIKGPTGEIVYEGKGRFVRMGREVREARHIALMAGGTGITPMYQVIQAVMKDREDGIRMSLVYANRTPEDILLREELEELARGSDKLKVWHTVGCNAGADWQCSVGRIDTEMVKKHLPAGGPDAIALVCGPPGMVDNCCLPILKAQGYTEDRILVF